MSWGVATQNGVSVSLASIVSLSAGVTEFSPADLFTGGVQGAWYDPSDVLLNWRTNLLTYSQEFDNAAWSKSNTTITANAATAPDATATADKLVSSATTSTHYASQVVTLAASTNYTVSVYVKAAEYGWAIVYIGTVGVGRYINLSSGAVGSAFIAAPTSTTVTDAGNGWWRVVVVFNSGANTSADIRVYGTTADATSSYLGDGTSGIYIWGAQLELGSTATTYQAITTPEQTYLTYDPQPVLYQDSSGTTPVTAVEQPVGLMLDKSQGLVLGSELVTNGTFATGTTSGFTATSSNVAGSSVINGELNVVAGGSGSGGFYQDITVVQGATYFLSVTARRIAGAGSVRFQAYDGAAFTTLIRQFFDITTTGAATTYSAYIRTTSTTTIRVYLYADTSTTGGFDDVSMKLMPGNHASQATAASRPVLRARYNLLTYSEQFDNAAWGARPGMLAFGSGSVANATAAPDGTTTADLLVPNTVAAAEHYADVAAIAFVSGASYTISVYAKASGYKWLRLAFNSSITPASERAAWFDVEAGTVGTVQTNVTANIVSVGNGWYRCSISRSATSSATPAQSGFIQITNADGGVGFTANGTSGMYWWGADLRTGSSAGTYQRIAAATDYATAGFLPYLDLITDDSLSTGSINFTATDKMFVCAGIQKNSDSGEGVIAELSASWSANNGTFVINAPADANPNLGFGLRGTTSTYFLPTTFTSPIRLVESCSFDISQSTRATEIVPRVNGTVNQTNPGGGTDAGTGNFGNHPMFIGRRNNASAPLNGRIYGLIVAGKQASASEISATEAWMNSKTGAY